MHAKRFVTSTQEQTHTPYLLGRVTGGDQTDYVTFTACKKSRFGLKRGKKAQCVSNRCKDLFERKKCFGVRCTLRFKCQRFSKVIFVISGRLMYYFMLQKQLNRIARWPSCCKLISFPQYYFNNFNVFLLKLIGLALYR